MSFMLTWSDKFLLSAFCISVGHNIIPYERKNAFSNFRMMDEGGNWLFAKMMVNGAEKYLRPLRISGRRCLVILTVWSRSLWPLATKVARKCMTMRRTCIHEMPYLTTNHTLKVYIYIYKERPTLSEIHHPGWQMNFWTFAMIENVRIQFWLNVNLVTMKTSFTRSDVLLRTAYRVG